MHARRKRERLPAGRIYFSTKTEMRESDKSRRTTFVRGAIPRAPINNASRSSRFERNDGDRGKRRRRPTRERISTIAHFTRKRRKKAPCDATRIARPRAHLSLLHCQRASKKYQCVIAGVSESRESSRGTVKCRRRLSQQETTVETMLRGCCALIANRAIISRRGARAFSPFLPVLRRRTASGTIGLPIWRGLLKNVATDNRRNGWRWRKCGADG